jgi:hypothetical protein
MANTELLRDPNEPDIYGDMEQKIAARKLEKQQELSDLLKNALGKNKEVSPTQAFAASALAILPMIIGRHYAGTEGASIGAQVAGATAPKYAQTLGQPDPEEVAAATSQAKVKQAEIDALTKQEGSLMSNRLQGQREMARDERLYGEGGLRERYEMRNEARNPKPLPDNSKTRDPEIAALLAKRATGAPLSEAQLTKLAMAGASENMFNPPAPPKTRSGPFGQMGTELTKSVAQKGTAAIGLYDLSQKLSVLPEKNIAQMALEKRLSAADQELIQQSAGFYLNKILRGESGTAARPDEMELIRKLAVGDFSVNSKQAARIMSNFARLEASSQIGVIDAINEPTQFVDKLRQITQGDGGDSQSEADIARIDFIEIMKKDKKPDGSQKYSDSRILEEANKKFIRVNK